MRPETSGSRIRPRRDRKMERCLGMVGTGSTCGDETRADGTATPVAPLQTRERRERARHDRARRERARCERP